MNQDVPQRWRSEQANWTQYQDAVSTFQLPDGTIDDTVKAFSDAILLATEKTVPQTGRTRRNKNVPWWNEEVTRVISEKKHAFNVFRRSPTQENMIEFKRLRAKARNSIITSKRQSWQNYVSSITTETPTTEVWQKITCIRGRKFESPSPVISVDNQQVTDQVEIAELFANYFEQAIFLPVRVDNSLRNPNMINYEVYPI
ncbi:hypothetical protein JTB14_013574 [Gonioctena quinquepunctata]|nr:hypothetical protein JTB14_013574 [Gonioctena quinquepunctata]